MVGTLTIGRCRQNLPLADTSSSALTREKGKTQVFNNQERGGRGGGDLYSEMFSDVNVLVP